MREMKQNYYRSDLVQLWIQYADGSLVKPASGLLSYCQTGGGLFVDGTPCRTGTPGEKQGILSAANETSTAILLVAHNVQGNTRRVQRDCVFIMVLLFPHVITIHSYNYIGSKLHSLGRIS